MDHEVLLDGNPSVHRKLYELYQCCAYTALSDFIMEYGDRSKVWLEQDKRVDLVAFQYLLSMKTTTLTYAEECMLFNQPMDEKIIEGVSDMLLWMCGRKLKYLKQEVTTGLDGELQLTKTFSVYYAFLRLHPDHALSKDKSLYAGAIVYHHGSWRIGFIPTNVTIAETEDMSAISTKAGVGALVRLYIREAASLVRYLLASKGASAVAHPGLCSTIIDPEAIIRQSAFTKPQLVTLALCRLILTCYAVPKLVKEQYDKAAAKAKVIDDELVTSAILAASGQYQKIWPDIPPCPCASTMGALTSYCRQLEGYNKKCEDAMNINIPRERYHVRSSESFRRREGRAPPVGISNVRKQQPKQRSKRSTARRTPRQVVKTESKVEVPAKEKVEAESFPALPMSPVPKRVQAEEHSEEPGKESKPVVSWNTETVDQKKVVVTPVAEVTTPVVPTKSVVQF
jgi:hypothetical protein